MGFIGAVGTVDAIGKLHERNGWTGKPRERDPFNTYPGEWDDLVDHAPPRVMRARRRAHHKKQIDEHRKKLWRRFIVGAILSCMTIPILAVFLFFVK